MKDDEQTKKRFNAIMNTFAEVFEKPTNKTKNRIYFQALKNYTIENIEIASKKILEEKIISTFPLPAEITEKMKSSKEIIEEILALNAWNKAEDIVLLGGRGSGDPVIDRTVELAFGSWQRFGETDPENTYDRHQFCKYFKLIHTQFSKDKLLDMSKDDIVDELQVIRQKIKQLKPKDGDKEVNQVKRG